MVVDDPKNANKFGGGDCRISVAAEFESRVWCYFFMGTPLAGGRRAGHFRIFFEFRRYSKKLGETVL